MESIKSKQSGEDGSHNTTQPSVSERTMTATSTIEPQSQPLAAPSSDNSQPLQQGTAGAYYNSPPAYPDSQSRNFPEYGNEQMTRSYVDERGEKKSNKAGTIGGGIVGYLLTGQLTGAAGGAILGNMYSKHKKEKKKQRGQE